MKDVEKKFIDLLGKETVKYIKNNNWVKFSQKLFKIYEKNEIEIKFLKKDGKGDTVIFFTICYNEDSQKWSSENCIDYPYIEFDTYEDMKSHVDDIEKDILNNGFSLVDLP